MKTDQSTQVYWHELPIKIPPWEEEGDHVDEQQDEKRPLNSSTTKISTHHKEMISHFTQGILSVASLLSTTNESALRANVASSDLLRNLIVENHHQSSAYSQTSSFIDPIKITREKNEEDKSEKGLLSKRTILAPSLTPLLTFNTALCYLGSEKTVTPTDLELSCRKVVNDYARQQREKEQQQQQQQQQNQSLSQNTMMMNHNNSQMDQQQKSSSSFMMPSQQQSQSITLTQQQQRRNEQFNMIEPPLYTAFKHLASTEVRRTAPVRISDGSVVRPTLHFRKINPENLENKVLTVQNYLGLGERVLFIFDPKNPSEFAIAFGVAYTKHTDTRNKKHLTKSATRGGSILILCPIQDPMGYVMKKKHLRLFTKETYICELYKTFGDDDDGSGSTMTRAMTSVQSSVFGSPFVSDNNKIQPISSNRKQQQHDDGRRRQREENNNNNNSGDDNDDDNVNSSDDDENDSDGSDSDFSETDALINHEDPVKEFSPFNIPNQNSNNSSSNNDTSNQPRAASATSTFMSNQRIRNRMETTKPALNPVGEKALSTYLQSKFNVLSFIRTRGASFFEDTGINVSQFGSASFGTSSLKSSSLASSSHHLHQQGGLFGTAIPSAVTAGAGGGARNTNNRNSRHRQSTGSAAAVVSTPGTPLLSNQQYASSMMLMLQQHQSEKRQRKSSTTVASSATPIARPHSFSPVALLAMSGGGVVDNSRDVIQQILPHSDSVLRRGGYVSLRDKAKDRWYLRILDENSRYSRLRLRDKVSRMQNMMNANNNNRNSLLFGSSSASASPRMMFGGNNGSQYHHDDDNLGLDFPTVYNSSLLSQPEEFDHDQHQYEGTNMMLSQNNNNNIINNSSYPGNENYHQHQQLGNSSASHHQNNNNASIINMNDDDDDNEW